MLNYIAILKNKIGRNLRNIEYSWARPVSLD